MKILRLATELFRQENLKLPQHKDCGQIFEITEDAIEKAKREGKPLSLKDNIALYDATLALEAACIPQSTENTIAVNVLFDTLVAYLKQMRNLPEEMQCDEITDKTTDNALAGAEDKEGIKLSSALKKLIKLIAENFHMHCENTRNASPPDPKTPTFQRYNDNAILTKG